MNAVIEKNIEDLGVALPEVAAPAANYVPYVISGNQLYISGQLPWLNGEKSHIGQLGNDADMNDAVEAARNCALNILAQAKAALDGDLGRVKRCVKLGGFVNAVSGFTDHPQIINGASDIMVQILGDAGKHARFAVGASSLPFGVMVEIDAVFEIEIGA